MIELASQGINIVLYKPEIPANTGNIGRLCVGTNSILQLIKPFRFFLDDKSLKRAGLDYWQNLNIKIWDNFDDLTGSIQKSSFYLCTTKTNKSYLNVKFSPGDYLIFGPESSGLPNEMLGAYPDYCITIPMSPKIRSINLSNSVAVILYEAIRQINS